MPITTPSFATRTFTTRHLLFAGAALCASAAAADARPRRIVVKEVDGDRAFADAADNALRKALAEYDFASAKTWDDAQAAARKTSEGSEAWAKAARKTGVGAIVDAFLERQGRHDVLVVKIYDATDGRELDSLTVRIGADGFTKAQRAELRDGLEQRLKWIEPDHEPGEAKKPAAELRIDGEDRGTRKPKLDDVLAPEPGKAKAKDKDVAVREGCFDLEDKCAVRGDLANPEKPALPERTTTMSFWAGLYTDSRSLTWDAPGDADLDQYTGVAGKGFVLGGELFPWPLRKWDGRPSGPGFSGQIYKSAGTVVGIDGDDSGDYTVDQSGFTLAFHWRQPLGAVWTVDGEVGYSRHSYTIEDPPMGYEVPDVSYSSAHAGVHVDLAIGKRASVGFGGRYFYTFSSGNLTDENTYGAGVTSGISLDANFKIPLPHKMFVKGQLEWRRFSTEFDMSGEISEMEQVRGGVDSTVGASLGIGVDF